MRIFFTRATVLNRDLVVTTQRQAEQFGVAPEPCKPPKPQTFWTEPGILSRGKEELAKQAREAQEKAPKQKQKGFRGFACVVWVWGFGFRTSGFARA